MLAAAEASFAEAGYSQTTMEAVAVRAGITVGSLYHHFASKLDLFDAVRSRQVEDLLAVLSTVPDEAESFGERLVALLGAARRLHAQPVRAVFVAMLPAQTRENPELAPIVERHSAGFRHLYERIVDDAVACHELPADVERDAVVGMVTSLVSGLSSASASNPEPAAFGAILDVYEALIRGAFAPPRSGPVRSSAGNRVST